MTTRGHTGKPLPLKDQLIVDIQDKIISGVWTAGMKLPSERELAEKMGLSRTLVNAALSELAAQGFIRVAPRSGYFVMDIRYDGTPAVLAAVMNTHSDDIDPRIFDNMMETRRLIECECCRLAAKQGQREDFERMSACLAEMQATTDAEAFCDAAYRFHYCLMQASQNVIYAMIYRSFEPALRYLMRNHYTAGITDRDFYVELHQRLVEVLRQGDAVRADECIRSILRIGVSALRKRYENEKRNRPAG